MSYYSPYYIIATDTLNLDVPEQQYWKERRGWGVLEHATVYTDTDRNSGVNLPRGGYWLRVTSEGISRPGGMTMPQHDFITNCSDLCPNCGSPDISAQDYSWVQLGVVINVACDHCDASWRVEGKVTGYSGLEVGEAL